MLGLMVNPMNITDYRIIRSDSESKVEEEVQKAIGAGWQPHGSFVHAAPDPDSGQDGWFYQPVVKIESDLVSALKDIESALRDIETTIERKET